MPYGGEGNRPTCQGAARSTQRLVGIISSSSSSDNGRITGNDGVSPPAATAYAEEYYRHSDGPKWKGSVRK